ncbi:MAG TPA: putative motility protein [Clostridiaceae bacterium]|nr:putative motility protein [Clostridiaceae bacterium]
MDIAAMSISLHQARLSREAGIAVLKKAMTSTETMAQDLLKMLEQSVTPHLGQNVDIRI